MTGPSNYARKIDRNHPEIVRALRAIGVEVADLSRAGHGVPDLCCFWRGKTTWIEIKNPDVPKNDQRLKDAQVRFHDAALRQGVAIHIVFTVPQALALFGAV